MIVDWQPMSTFPRRGNYIFWGWSRFSGVQALTRGLGSDEYYDRNGNRHSPTQWAPYELPEPPKGQV